VSNIENYNEQVSEISLKPNGEEIQYQAGQFAFFKFNDTELGSQTHPFSFSSSPGGKMVKITVKNLGDFTARLINVKPGTEVMIEGPYGRFLPNQNNNEQVWVAGGIGITPFISLARALANSGAKINVFYCVKDPAEAVFLKELQTITRINTRIKVSLHCSSTNNRISAEIIKKEVGDLLNKDYYLCGPAGLMMSVREQLVTAHVSNERIHSEEFSL